MTVENQTRVTLYGQYAGFVSRLVALIIDLVLVSLVISLISIIGGFVLDALLGIDFLPAASLTQTIGVILIGTLAVVFYLLYYLGFWMLVGQTPGKWIMGVRIVRTGGERMRFRDAAVRLVGYWLSTILFLGYLWVLVDNRRQGFHDKLAGTLVIYAWPEDEAKMEKLHQRSQRLRQKHGTRRESEQP